MENLPSDVYTNITKYLKYNDIFFLCSTNKYISSFLWKGPYWSEQLNENMTIDINGRQMFMKTYFRCHICNRLTKTDKCYKNYLDEKMCLECLCNLFICTIS